MQQVVVEQGVIIPQFIVSAIGTVTSNSTLMLMIIAFIFLIVGTFMDAIPAIVILAPLLKPLAEYAHIDPLHFAITGIISLSFGLITPPYGLSLLITSEIAEINCTDALKEVGAFLVVMLVILLLIICVPNISLFIPKLFLPGLFQ